LRSGGHFLVSPRRLPGMKPLFCSQRPFFGSCSLLFGENRGGTHEGSGNFPQEPFFRVSEEKGTVHALDHMPQIYPEWQFFVFPGVGRPVFGPRGHFLVPEAIFWPQTPFFEENRGGHFFVPEATFSSRRVLFRRTVFFRFVT